MSADPLSTSSGTSRSPTPKPHIRSPFDFEGADIIIRSADNIDFRVYKFGLKIASAIFLDMFTLPDTSDEPQVVEVTESADTLDALLRFCYPVGHPVFSSLDQLIPVVHAAKKYEMSTVMEDALRDLEPLSHTSPSRVYALGCCLTRPDIARQGAKLLLSDPHYMAPSAIPPEYLKSPLRSTVQLCTLPRGVSRRRACPRLRQELASVGGASLSIAV